MICSTPNNHIRNLDVALNGSNASLTSPTTADRPQPPINHHILTLTAMFQDAIQENDIFELTPANNQYTQAMNSNPDFSLYDHSNLRAVHKIAMQILNSHTAVSTPLPASPPNSLIHTQTTQPPSASFKSPKLTTGVASPMISIPGCPLS